MILDKMEDNNIGISNNITNPVSEKRYMIVTAPEKVYGYWSTAIIPFTKMISSTKGKIIEQEFPDVHNPIKWFVTYGQKEAMERHAQISDIVRRYNTEFWWEYFPCSFPEDDPDSVIGGIISYSRNERAWGDRYIRFEQ